MEVDRNGLQVLGRDECFALLQTATLGRIGCSSGALPMVLPVNFVVDGDRILVRTSPGTKLDAALRDSVVAFEVDDFDPMFHSGWSVVVTGVARVVEPADGHATGSHGPIARWAPLGQDHVVSISTELVSGRRLTPETLASSGDWHPPSDHGAARLPG